MTGSSGLRAGISFWLSTLGFILVAAGLLAISPVADLLPVEWVSLRGDASKATVGSRYVKVAPARDSSGSQWYFVAIGMLSILISLLIKKWQNTPSKKA